VFGQQPVSRWCSSAHFRMPTRLNGGGRRSMARHLGTHGCVWCLIGYRASGWAQEAARRKFGNASAVASTAHGANDGRSLTGGRRNTDRLPQQPADDSAYSVRIRCRTFANTILAVTRADAACWVAARMS
jgi:hypothetical protein